MTAVRRKSSEAWTWQLTQIECQRRGWHVERVSWTERYPRKGGGLVVIQRDLLAAFDALAWQLPQHERDKAHPWTTYALQITGGTGGNRAARRRKLAEHPLREMLQAAGWLLLVWSWRMKGSEAVLSEDVIR